MKKYTKKINGETYVGVVLSGEYGFGWSTENNVNPFDYGIINYLINNENLTIISDTVWLAKYLNEEKFIQYLKENEDKYDFEYEINELSIPYNLKICWIKEDTQFIITENDGKEHIVTVDEMTIYTA